VRGGNSLDQESGRARIPRSGVGELACGVIEHLPTPARSILAQVLAKLPGVHSDGPTELR